MSPATIRLRRITSPDIIRLRRTTTRADLTQVMAQDRVAAVAAHTRVAAVAVDIHPTAAVDHRLAVAEAVLHRTVAEGIANRTQVPVRTVSGGAEHCPLNLVDKIERATVNQPSLFLLFRMKRTFFYQTPLSLPVILNATAAADASGGNKLSRNVAGTLPLKAACVICLV